MKKIIIVFLILFLVLVVYGIYWAFFDIQRLDGQELIREIPSPNGSQTILVYRNNGGATTGYAVLCTVRKNSSGRERNIYWQYRYEDADVQWLDEKTAVINGIVLQVWRDSYDYRHPKQ